MKATVEHRGSLVIRADDGPLSAEVTNTDPAYRKDGSLGVALETFEPVVAHCEPLSDTDEAHHAAELTNRFVEESAKILDASDVNAERRRRGQLPANLILTRDGGDHLPALQSINDRFGPEWGCFVEMPVERGIAKMLGMHPVPAPRLGIDVPMETRSPSTRSGRAWPPTPCPVTTPCTSTSRDPMCRHTTVVPRTSGTSSPRSTPDSSPRCCAALDLSSTIVAVTATTRRRASARRTRPSRSRCW